MAVSRPERALREITKLRYRRRRLRTLDGLIRLAASTALLVWITFAVDYFLDLPVPVRGLQLAAGLVLAFLALRIFILTARRPVTDSWLAAQVEGANDELDQSLITAVQLAGQDNPRRELYSPVLLERTVAEAEERIQSIRAASLVSMRGVLSSMTILLLLFVPIAAGAVLRNDLAGVYVDRVILLQDIAWPRSYFLVVDEPVETDTLVAMGDALSVLVRKERGGGARVTLRATFADDSRETFTLERKGDEAFRHVFRNVTEDFDFRIVCGDFRSAEYSVRVRNRPRIEEISLEFDYPDYTGLDRLTGDGSESPARNLGGHVKVPVETVVRYQAETSIPVSRATRVFVYEEGGEEKQSEEELEVAGNQVLAGSFVADRRGYYYFRLASEDGFENPSPIRYRVAVIEDRPPAVQIGEPGKNLEVSRRAAFDLALEGSDDYGLVAGALVLRKSDLDGNPEAAEEIDRRDFPEFATGEREVAVASTLDLESLALVEGDRIEYFAEAKDARDQSGFSRTYVLTIVSEDDLLRILQDELNLIRESLEQALGVQKETRREIEGVLETLIGGAKLREKSLAEVRHARLNQERVSLRLEENVERLRDLLGRVVSNRLVWAELPRVNSVTDRLATVSTELAPPALESLAVIVRGNGERNAARSDVVGAFDQQRAVERALEEILLDLRKWGDLNSIAQKLQEALDRQKDLEERLKEKIKEGQK